MKLFTKTMLSFTSVIILGSALFAFFVTDSVRRTNHEDAKRELQLEAQMSYDNFNSWKRNIWASLVALQDDARLSALVGTPSALARPEAARVPILDYLRGTFLRSGYDVVYVRTKAIDDGYAIPVSDNRYSAADFEMLSVEREHPYVQIRQVGAGMAITGAIRIADVDFYILKRIDDALCDALDLNRNSVCAFYLDDAYLAGSRHMQPAPRLDLSRDNSYGERYAWEIDGQRYNVAGERIPNVLGEESGVTLTLVTFVSDLPYEQRLAGIRRIILFVTGVSGLASLLLSIGLSSNISVPVQRLALAMQRFRHGELVRVRTRQNRDEISALVSGFNEMASTLQNDRFELDRYLREITFLNEYNERVIESIHAGIVVIDELGIVAKVNARFCKFVSVDRETIVGQPADRVDPTLFDDELLALVRGIGSRARVTVDHTRRTRQGSVFELTVSPVHTGATDGGLGCVVFVEDITEQLRLEQKIFQAEKLSSLTMLSAGVAHEINNPLGSIMTNVQNLLSDEPDPEKHIALRWIEQETHRIAATVAELLRFAAPDSDPAAGSDVNAVVAEAIALIRYALKREGRIAITTAFEPALPFANIAPGELKQVLINLLHNSMQAIRGDGSVSVSTRSRSVGAVEIEVADTGVGMNNDTMARIFDPFFTTKTNGEGTGLGLSVVYGILQKYRSTISVDSREGCGTRMIITLNALPSGISEERT